MVKKVLAVASSGGHWTQLLRLRPCLENFETIYASTDRACGEAIGARYFTLRDASLWDKIGLFVLAFQVFRVVLKVRPHVVITTGAAPGYFAVIWGKLFGAKTVWIDSIANVDKLSKSGLKSRVWVDVWLTQWPHLEENGGPKYKGAVL